MTILGNITNNSGQNLDIDRKMDHFYLKNMPTPVKKLTDTR